ncbi:MAG: alpha/beta hydrolase [Paludibacteraceae bacterium]
MRKIILPLIILSLFISLHVYSAKVDTVLVYSQGMKKSIKTVVVTPDTYNNTKLYPVLYLLNGYSGNYKGWIEDMPSTKALADSHQFIIVCPDGGYSSWYFDSPIDSTWRYETFVSKELINWIDKNYKTIAKREGRAISGLSMGGHGGLFLGFRHQDIFGACGSMSGGVDIRPFPNKWEISKRLGTQRLHPENWEKYTVINQLHLLTPNSIKIIFDCGTEDFFYKANVKLHEELTYRNIPHDFISRPGAHDRYYWDNAVQYQALFFSNYFNSGK